MFILVKYAIESSFALYIFGSFGSGLFGESPDGIDGVGLGTNDALNIREVRLKFVDVGNNLIVGLNVFAVGLD
jgi:hypothetical protein